MAKRFPGKRLIWLLPLVIAAGLLLAVLVAALAIRLAGWHWQGPGWRDGLTLDAVWQETDGCRPLEARGVRLSALRPLTLGIDTLGIHACPDDADTASDGLTDIPSLPALEVTVWAVQYRDLPPVMVNLSQRDGAWRARAEFRDSRLSAEYRRGSGRWRLDGTLQGGHLDQRLAGEVRVQGDGLWLPGDWTDPEHFTGELVLLGRDLGLETPGPRGNVTVRGQWQGDAWRLRAGLDEPLAIEEGLLLMGFPIDLFEGLGLGENAKWRLLGNSVNVFDLMMFYESLKEIHHARHGSDLAAERRTAIEKFRAARSL